MISSRRPTRVLVGVVVFLGTSACHHAPPPEQAAIVRADSRSFRPILVADASAVTLDVPLPSDTGECVVRQNPLGSGRVVWLYLPNEKTATAVTTLQVQRDGRIANYSDRRGRAIMQGMKGATDAQLDSLFAAARTAERSTTISLDYAFDRALVSNDGGGRPDTHYMLPLAAIAHDPRFGAPADRAQTVMTRCDVPASDRGQVTR